MAYSYDPNAQLSAENQALEENIKSGLERYKQAFAPTASEQDLKDAQASLAGYEGRLRDLNSGDPTKIESIYTLEGFSPISSRPKTFTINGNKVEGKELETIGDPIETVQQSLRDKIAGLNQRISGLGEQVKSEHIDRLSNRSGELTSELFNTQRQINSALDAKLAQSLQDIGFKADLSRETAAAAYAGRGLERSTVKASGFNQIGLAEQSAQAQQRVKTGQIKSELSSNISKDLIGIQRAEQRAKMQRDLASISAAEDIAFTYDKADLVNNINKQLYDMELDSHDTNLFGGIIGGILGGVAGGFAAGPAGAAIGASAGAGVGGSI